MSLAVFSEFWNHHWTIPRPDTNAHRGNASVNKAMTVHNQLCRDLPERRKRLITPVWARGFLQFYHVINHMILIRSLTLTLLGILWSWHSWRHHHVVISFKFEIRAQFCPIINITPLSISFCFSCYISYALCTVLKILFFDAMLFHCPNILV